MTIPIAAVGGVMAGLISPAQNMLSGNYGMSMIQLVYNYTGYDIGTGAWRLAGLKNGFVPAIIGIAGHKLATMAGVNRVLAQAKVPLLRI